jgi:NAD-specific glutamate dehydrogenase
VRRLIEDLMTEQATLSAAVARQCQSGDGADEARAAEVVADWIGPRAGIVDQVRRTIDEIEQSGQGWSFAKLTIANASSVRLLPQRAECVWRADLLAYPAEGEADAAQVSGGRR